MDEECHQATIKSKENNEQGKAKLEQKEEEKQMEELAPGTTLDSQQESFDKTLAMSADKAVSTYGIPDLRDYQRAVTYELVFNSLLEKKMQAMKRDCEERKRAKRLKRKSIGRIFFAKRLFSSMDSRKTSSLSEMAIEEELHARTEPSTPQKTMKSTIKTATKEQTQQQQQQQPKSPDIEIEATSKKMSSQRSSYRSRTRSKSKTNTASSESPQTTTNTQQQADDSVTSTLSNSSDKVVVKQNLLVKAQTHMPQEALIVSSSSGDSKNAQTTQSNGNQTYSIVPPLSLERTQDTASLASGYENGTGARLHSSTMADDSLTSIRDSIESLSFASSRCTVSFGATEVIHEDRSGR